jgi:uncharacterized protein YuzE
MNTKYDKTADALYMRFNKGKIVKTLRLEDRLIVDLDGKSNILGIEVLNVKSQFAGTLLKQISKNSKAQTLAFV